MRIHHLAIYTNNLDRLKDFYANYFGAVPGEKYVNPIKQFQSYFLSFDDGSKLEIMQQDNIPANANDPLRQATGLIHFAISVGSKENVNRLTETLRRSGFAVAGEPRTTGDGYYESVVLDPDGNRVELTL